MPLQKLITEADRLIVSQLTADRIKGTRIRHIDGHRPAIASLDEPYRTLGLRFLDVVIAFAHAVNDDDPALAERIANDIKATLAEVEGR